MKFIPAASVMAILVGCLTLTYYFPEWGLYMKVDSVRTAIVFAIIVVMFLFFRKFSKDHSGTGTNTITITIGNYSKNHSMTMMLFTDRSPYYESNITGNLLFLASSIDGRKISEVLNYIRSKPVETFMIKKVEGNRLNKIDFCSIRINPPHVQQKVSYDTVRQLEFGQSYPADNIQFGSRCQRIALAPGETIQIVFKMTHGIAKDFLQPAA